MNSVEMAVIHDIKNILHHVLVRISSYQQVKDEVAYLNQINSKLTSILLLNKYDQNEFDLLLDCDAPAEVVEDSVSTFAAIYSKLNIKDISNNPPSMWFYDRQYLQIAINSGLDNAGRYAKKNITVNTEVERGFLVITIKDDGPGFKQDVIDKFNENNFVEASEEGSGLGIVLAHRICSMHKRQGKTGRIEISNAPSGGAVFKIYIP